MSIVDNQRIRRIFAVIFLTLCGSLSLPAYAEGWKQQVNDYLLGRWLEVSGDRGEASISYPGLPDSYQLADCQGPLRIDPVRALQPGRNGVEISCSSPFWKQHLAVQLHSFQAVAVLARAVPADAVLGDDDINYVRRDTGELSQGFFTERHPLSGMVMRRSQRAGTIISANMVEAAVVIERNDQVVIEVNRPGIRIEMKGTALEDACAGERLRVRNNQSGKVVMARAVRRGLVQVQ